MISITATPAPSGLENSSTSTNQTPSIPNNNPSPGTESAGVEGIKQPVNLRGEATVPAELEQQSDPRNQPAVPLRSSSDPKLRTGNPDSAGPSNPQEKISRRGSKSSLGVKQRDGSVASSKRSERRQINPPGTVSQPVAATVVTTATGPTKQRRGGLSKFLSFLNCCGAPEDANDIDLEESNIPARKPNKLQQTQIRQQTPVVKADVSAAESSTAESKEMSDEKIAGTPYADLKSAGEPIIQKRPEVAAPALVPNLLNSAETPGDQKVKAPSSEKPLAQDPGTIVSGGPSEEPPQNTIMHGGLQPPPAAVLVEPPTPTLPDHADDVNDRTPIQEKRDSDIEMKDAPPVVPVAEEPSRDTSRKEAETTQSLPPPPPRGDAQFPGHERNVSNSSNVPTEQKWLLPPIRSEFKGKKCLVLDLDETLVHSSFKVALPDQCLESR